MMIGLHVRSFAAKAIVSAVIVAMLAGCGGGKNSKVASAAATASQSTSQPVAAAPSANSAPTITGSPQPQVSAGSDYKFVPAASDTNADALGFTITNRPEWATFDTVSGTLTGKPTAAHVGAYSDIAISVSDGTHTTALPPFTINVTTMAGTDAGAAQLSWTAPTQNTDGSAITDLAGFQISYGPSADALNQTVTINNPSVSTYMVEGLSAGTWYFALAAVNSKGATSTLSNVASKQIS